MGMNKVQQNFVRALLSLSIATSLGVTSYAFDIPESEVDIQAVDYTNGLVKLQFLDKIVEGVNDFDVISNIPCAVFLEHSDGSHESLGCAVVDADSGRYRFRANLKNGDKIGVVLTGDVNCDGFIDIMDYARLYQFINGTYELSTAGFYSADLDFNSTVDIMDYARLYQFLNGTYTPSWDVSWELPDDPNIDATATLSTNGVNEVHIGDSVLFTLDTDVTGDYDVEYKLMKNNAPVNNIALDSLGATGGKVFFNTVVGDYTLYATVITETSREIEADPVTISVTNEAPVLTDDVDVFVDYDDITLGYDESVHVWVEPVGGGAIDPDGDDVTLKFESNGKPFTGAYYPAGTHEVQVYAVDAYGAKSEVKTISFTVDAVNTIPPLTSDTKTVHIGDFFDIDIAEIVEDKFTRIEVRDENGELVECDLSQMNKTGGKLAITGGTGDFTVHAIGVDYHGAEVDFGFINVTVTNDAPYVPQIIHTVNPTDFQYEYELGSAKIGVDFTNQVSDPNNDEVTLWVVHEDGSPDTILFKPEEQSMGYYLQGHHSITLYAVDEWGAKSEQVTYEFDIDNVLPTGHFVAIVDYEDLRYENDKPSSDTLMAHVDISIVTEDADGNNTKVEFTNKNGEPLAEDDILKTGYYKDGTYTVYYYVVDQWGERSDLITESFSVDLAPETPTIDVSGESELTVHVGDEFTIDVDTKHFGTATVRYELIEKGTGVDYSDQLVGADGILTYTGGVARILREGIYELKATIVPSVGEEYLIGVVHTTVTNAAPTVPDVQVNISGTNVIVDEDNDVLSYVDISITSTDADPNDEFVYEFTSGEDLVSGYYENGTYTIVVRAVDEWGKASDYATCTFTVDNFDSRPRFITPSVIEHIGTDFEIEMHEGSLELDAENPITYTLVDSEGHETIVSGLTISGGIMNIDTATGVYTLKAVAHIDNNGDGQADVDYYVGDISIEITNTAPTIVVDDISVPTIETDPETNVDIGTVDVVVTTGDVDGDDYELYYQLDNEGDLIKADSTNGFTFEIPVGEHILTMYTVDEWGLKSEIIVEEVMVGSLFSTNEWLPVLEHTETGTFYHSHQPDSEENLTFDITWIKDGEVDVIPTDEEITFVYELDGNIIPDLNTHYTLGKHVLKVYAIDDYGIHSEVAVYEFELKTITPEVTLEYWWNEVTDKVELKSKVAYSSDQDIPSEAVARYKELISRVYVTNLTAGTEETLVETYEGLRGDIHLPDYVLVNYGFEPGSRYSVRLESVNVWGKSSSQTVEFLVPVNAPSYTIDNHILGTYSPETGLTQVSFEYSSFMMGKDYTFEYTIDGEPVDTLDGEYTVGTHTVTVQAIHNSNPALNSKIDTYTFEITNSAPSNPVVTVNVHRDDVSEDGKVNITFDVNTSDPDSDTVTYNIYPQVDGFEDLTGQADLSGMNGYYSTLSGNLFAVEAVDMHGNTSGRVYVRLDFTNSAPVINEVIITPDYDSSVTDNGVLKVPVNFDCLYTDADGDICEVTYEISKQIIENGSLIEAGTHTVLVTVTDSFGKSSTKTQKFTIEVEAPDSATFTYETADASVEENFINPYTSDAALKTTFTVLSPVDGYTYEWTINSEIYTGTTVDVYIPYDAQYVSLVAIDSFGQRGTVYQQLVDPNAGSKPVLSVKPIVDEDDFINEYTEDAAVHVTFDSLVSGSSLYQIYYKNLNDDSDFTLDIPDGYLTAINNRYDAYVIDVWGRQSKTISVSVDLTNEAPSTPNIDFKYYLNEAGVVNPYTEDAEVRVTVNDNITDDDDFKVYYYLGRGTEPLEQLPETFPVNQRFDIGVYAVDKWGNTTDVVWKTLDIQVVKPVVNRLEMASFTFDDIVNPYTLEAYVETPITVYSNTNNVKYYVTYDGELVYEGTTAVGDSYNNSKKVKVTVENAQLEAYVIDIFGQKSEVLTRTFVNSAFGWEPSISNVLPQTLNNYIDAYTLNARRQVRYDVGSGVSLYNKVFVYDEDGELVGSSDNGTTVFEEYLPLGNHTRKFVVYDVWGRSAQVTSNFSLTNKAPIIDLAEGEINWGKIENKYSSNALVEVQSIVDTTDVDSGTVLKYFYSIDSGEYVEYPAFNSFMLGKGNHIIKVKAVDEWGYESDVYTYEVNVSTGITVDLSGYIDEYGYAHDLQVSTNIPSDLDNNARFYKVEYQNAGGPYELIASDTTQTVFSVPRTDYTDMTSYVNHTLTVRSTSIIGEVVYDSIVYKLG